VPKRDQLPDNALIVTEYDEFRGIVQAFVDGHHELLVVIGDPGLGKSEEIRRRMQAKFGVCKWALIQGKHTPLDLYRKLYHARLLPVVIDDLDGLFSNSTNTAILKCVCDTRLVKRVEYGSTHPAFTRDDDPLPSSFDSISRVSIIANEWQTVSKNLQAIQDRGLLIFFRPSAVEVHREVARARWFDDPEIFEFIGRHLPLITRPSFRLYITAKNHKQSRANWRDLMLRTIENEATSETILVARLLADPSYDAMSTPEAARKEAFQRLGGGSWATYHRHKNKLRQLQNHLGPAVFTSVFQPNVLMNAFKSADAVIGVMNYINNPVHEVVSEIVIKNMKQGSVLLDLRIDQGGCFETTCFLPVGHPVIFEKHGVLHYCVSNLSSRVARTAAMALSNIFVPLIMQLSESGGAAGIPTTDVFRSGLYVYGGKLVNNYVAKQFNLTASDISLYLSAF